MSKCNHVVAVFGENQITQDDFEQAAKDWVKKVKFYNENTLRIQITPPSQSHLCELLHELRGYH